MESIAFSLAYALPAGFCRTWRRLSRHGSYERRWPRNPEKINDLRTLMILGISFIDALAIIGFIVAIVGKVM